MRLLRRLAPLLVVLIILAPSVLGVTTEVETNERGAPNFLHPRDWLKEEEKAPPLTATRFRSTPQDEQKVEAKSVPQKEAREQTVPVQTTVVKPSSSCDCQAKPDCPCAIQEVQDPVIKEDCPCSGEAACSCDLESAPVEQESSKVEATDASKVVAGPAAESMSCECEGKAECACGANDLVKAALKEKSEPSPDRPDGPMTEVRANPPKECGCLKEPECDCREDPPTGFTFTTTVQSCDCQEEPDCECAKKKKEIVFESTRCSCKGQPGCPCDCTCLGEPTCACSGEGPKKIVPVIDEQPVRHAKKKKNPALEKLKKLLQQAEHALEDKPVGEGEESGGEGEAEESVEESSESGEAEGSEESSESAEAEASSGLKGSVEETSVKQAKETTEESGAEAAEESGAEAGEESGAEESGEGEGEGEGGGEGAEAGPTQHKDEGKPNQPAKGGGPPPEQQEQQPQGEQQQQPQGEQQQQPQGEHQQQEHGEVVPEVDLNAAFGQRLKQLDQDRMALTQDIMKTKKQLGDYHYPGQLPMDVGAGELMKDIGSLDDMNTKDDLPRFRGVKPVEDIRPMVEAAPETKSIDQSTTAAEESQPEPTTEVSSEEGSTEQQPLDETKLRIEVELLQELFDSPEMTKEVIMKGKAGEVGGMQQLAKVLLKVVNKVKESESSEKDKLHGQMKLLTLLIRQGKEAVAQKQKVAHAGEKLEKEKKVQKLEHDLEKLKELEAEASNSLEHEEIHVEEEVVQKKIDKLKEGGAAEVTSEEKEALESASPSVSESAEAEVSEGTSESSSSAASVSADVASGEKAEANTGSGSEVEAESGESSCDHHLCHEEKMNCHEHCTTLQSVEEKKCHPLCIASHTECVDRAECPQWLNPELKTHSYIQPEVEGESGSKEWDISSGEEPKQSSIVVEADVVGEKPTVSPELKKECEEDPCPAPEPPVPADERSEASEESSEKPKEVESSGESEETSKEATKEATEETKDTTEETTEEAKESTEAEESTEEKAEESGESTAKLIEDLKQQEAKVMEDLKQEQSKAVEQLKQEESKLIEEVKQKGAKQRRLDLGVLSRFMDRQMKFDEDVSLQLKNLDLMAQDGLKSAHEASALAKQALEKAEDSDKILDHPLIQLMKEQDSEEAEHFRDRIVELVKEKEESSKEKEESSKEVSEESSKEESSKESSEESSKEESSKESTEEASKETTEEASKETTEETSKESTEEASKESTEESTEEASKESTEEASKESTEESTEEASKESTEEASKETTEETSKESTEEAFKESTEESTEEASKESTEEASKETTEEASKETAEETKETTEHASKESTEEASKETTEEESTEESSEEGSVQRFRSNRQPSIDQLIQQSKTLGDTLGTTVRRIAFAEGLRV